MRRSTIWILLGAVVALGACSDQQGTTALDIPAAASRLDAYEYDVIDLGTFDGAPTQALGLDKHGTTYGVYGAGTASRSFRWTRRDRYEDLGDFDGQPFRFLNTNDHGLLAGSILSPAGQRAVVFLPREGFRYIDDGNRGSAAAGNEQGTVAGTRTLADGSQAAFTWTREDGVRLLSLEVPGLITSSAGFINDAGAVVGALGYREMPTGPIHRRAFVWHPENGTTLIPPLNPGAGNVGVTFISDDGIAVGASETRLPQPGEIRANPLSPNPGDVPVHAWKWSATMGLVDLGTLGGNHSVAWKVDREGNVYGWASDASGLQHAVKWTAAGEIARLGTLGGLSITGGLNKHGVVVGWSRTADGTTHAVQFHPRR